MMEQHKLAIAILIFLATGQAKMMRNSALITKMVSNFHQNNDLSEPKKESDSVLIRMQVVLCKNFPTIPCELITKDKTLKKLIEKSIQQINNKKISLDNKTTKSSGYRTLFPTLNNDDLSKFIQMSEVVYSPQEKKHNQKKKIDKTGNRKVKSRAMEKKSREKRKKIYKNKSKHSSGYNRKKLRKFYPHMVKYPNKNSRKVDIADKTGEKFSMSLEAPDMPLAKQHQHLTYKVEPDNPPVWRIDYTKHGEPSLHVFDYDGDRFNGKITKTGLNVLVDESEHTRKNIVHPDVFIKNNFVKTYSDNSEGVD